MSVNPTPAADLVEKLRELQDGHPAWMTIYGEAADAIEALADRLAVLEARQAIEISVDDRSVARMLRQHVSEWLKSADRTEALALFEKILATEPRRAAAGEQDPK